MRTAILFVIAIVVAGGAAFSVKNMLGGDKAGDAQASIELPKVMVATKPIPAGTFVRADTHLSWMEWPSDNLHKSYIRPTNVTLEDFNGAVARGDISAGEPITATRIIKPGEGGFMSAVLSPGLRAVSIAVTLTSGNAGFVFPGDRVDLILTHEVPNDDGTRGFASETILEDVRVLAMDQRYNAQPVKDKPVTTASPARTATLEVTGNQVEMIHVAGELGKISMSLRSLGRADDENGHAMQIGGNLVQNGKSFTRDSDVSRLLGRTQVHATTPRKVSVVRGEEAVEIEFDGVR